LPLLSAGVTQKYVVADYAVGFGGKFGVQADRQDKSAVGWDHHEGLHQHQSQTDHSKVKHVLQNNVSELCENCAYVAPLYLLSGLPCHHIACLVPYHCKLPVYDKANGR
jgi:hypothetical protein